MKLTLTCPNRQFSAAHAGSRAIVDELTSIGFVFMAREVPGGVLLSAVGSIEIELGSVEDLLELQRRIGLPIQVEDGTLEIRG